MTNPTSNFGWQMPTSTDLVTDLPADFETFGQAVDTSLADLKGGTTGQVLSKASNTDMDFTWVAQDDSNAIQNAIVDAKGDLIAASAADTPARLAVGANGETLVADSSTSTGLSYQANWAAGKNKIINGDFTINQRAFTTSTTSAAYGFDRFMMIYVDGTVTYSAQTFTPGTAPVAGYEAKNFARIVTSGQTLASARANWKQPIENVRTLAGQTATVSFWAKAASGTPKIAVELWQGFGSGGSPSAGVPTYAGQVTLSTSWARYSVTVAVPSISGKTIGTTDNSSELQCNLFVSAGSDLNSRTGSLGIQSNTFDIWGVQVEAGSVATAFQTATGTIQGELAACQRYYFLLASGFDLPICNAFYYNSNQVRGNITFPVQMRTAPSLVSTIGTNYYKAVNSNASDPFNSFTILIPHTTGSQIYNASEASGTDGKGTVLSTENASASIAFSAEL